MQRVARRLCALALAAAAVAGCTADETARPARQPTHLELSGAVLARTEAGRALVVIDPRDGTEQPVTMPPGSVLVHHASFAQDGSIVAVVEGPFGRFGAYRLGVEQEPEPIGPMLRGVFSFDADERSILASSCDRRRPGYLLDLAAPAAWREVDAACGAALSPDGRAFATPVRGTRVDVAPIDAAGKASTVFRLDDGIALGTALPAGARVTGRIAWDDPGMAFLVGTEDIESLVLLPDGERPSIETIGPHAEWLETTLSWQPRGSLLGLGGATRIEGMVRIADAATGDARVVAILREPPFGIVWSPDGAVLLASTLGRWTFLGPDGSWLRVLPYSRGRALPMDWRP